MAPKVYYGRKRRMSKKSKVVARKSGPRRSGRKHVGSLRRSKRINGGRARGKGFNPFKGLVSGLSTFAQTGNPVHAGVSGLAGTFF